MSESLQKFVYLLLHLLLVLALALPALASGSPELDTGNTAVALYRRLAGAGLDPARVYQVREAALDREDIHLTLVTGTIAFLQAVDGRVTGAFFEGEGEVLLSPPNQVERTSLAFFTGAAILEEKFSTAFLRFNDDTWERLQPFLRPADDPQAFLSRWDPVVRSLSRSNALELLQSFTYRGPGQPGVLLHARLAGSRLGTFDLALNTNLSEQISVGQASYLNGALFYNLWTSFPMRSLRQPPRDLAGPPPENELGRRSLRILQYRIRAHVVPPHELEADTLLTVEALQTGPRTLLFELSRYLKLAAVTADGIPIEFLQNEALEGGELARRGNDLVAVVLPQPLQAGQKLELRFLYAGSVLSEAGGGLMYVGARGIWYPNRGPAMSQFDLEFRYPAEWTLVATGKRLSTESSGGEQVSRWVSERPMPLAGFNLGKYVSSQAQAAGTTVETFAARGLESTFPTRPAVEVLRVDPLKGPHTRVVLPPPPPDPAVQAKAVAERSARAVAFLSRHLGPFPYSSLALTQMPGRHSQGWPGLVFLSSYAFLSGPDRQRLGLDSYENLFFGELVQVHETAHQWWGDAVLWKTYRDVWLSEALANYCSLLLVEQERPADFRLAMDHYRQDLLRTSKDAPALREAGPVTLGWRLSSSRLPGAYDAVLYGRGTWLFHMLRSLFRDADAQSRRTADPDARFFRVLRALRERFDGRQMSTDDVRQAFEDALPDELRYEGHKTLAWFFDGWVNGNAIPRFELANVSFSQKSGKMVVSGALLQKDAPEALVTSVPLYAHVGGGKPVYLGRVFADGPETTFRLSAPAGARKLLLDPYWTVLRQP